MEKKAECEEKAVEIKKERRADNMYRKCRWNSPLHHPKWNHFPPLWVKRKPGWKWKVTQAREPRPSDWERRRSLLLFKAPAIVWAPIQAYCCVEISRAPFGSRGMRQTPLLFWFQICGWIDAWPRLPSPLAVALCPLSQSTVSFCFLSHPLAVRTLAGQHSYSFPSLSFVLLLSFGVYAYCSLEYPHYKHGYILRASRFDFGLVGSEWWAGGSCRAAPAFRAPQPASRRVGLGVLLGWALLQKHWCYC